MKSYDLILIFFFKSSRQLELRLYFVKLAVWNSEFLSAQSSKKL